MDYLVLTPMDRMNTIRDALRAVESDHYRQSFLSPDADPGLPDRLKGLEAQMRKLQKEYKAVEKEQPTIEGPDA